MAGKTVTNPDVANAANAEMIATDEVCKCPQCGYEGPATEFGEPVDEGETSARLNNGKTQDHSELKKGMSPKDLMIDMMK